jgi:DNA uptake protein ComE-like DNA-binding protein
MQTLESQREKILAGEAPEIAESAVAFEDELLGEQGVVSFEAMRSGASANAEVALPRAIGQSAMLDVNLADAAALVKLGCDEALAGRIIASRPPGGYALADDVQGEFGAPGDVQPSASGGSVKVQPVPLQAGVPLPEPSLPGANATALKSALVATSWDCQEPGQGVAGTPLASMGRQLLGAGLDDRVKNELDRLVGAAARAQVELMLGDAAWKGKRMSDVVRALAAAGVAPRQIGAVIDLVTAEASRFPRGRIDLVRAEPRVMATLPGIDAALAEKMATTRATFDAASLADPAWPVSQGVLTIDQFAAIADVVTNRSMQWRIRVRARIERLGGAVDQAGSSSTRLTSGSSTLSSSSGGDRSGVVMDAILDCSGSKVRVVAMYDATWQPWAESVARSRVVVGAVGAAEEGAGKGTDGDGATELEDAGPPEDRPVMPREEDGGVMIRRRAQPEPERSESVRTEVGGSTGGGRSGRWRPR